MRRPTRPKLVYSQTYLRDYCQYALELESYINFLETSKEVPSLEQQKRPFTAEQMNTIRSMIQESLPKQGISNLINDSLDRLHLAVNVGDGDRKLELVRFTWQGVEKVLSAMPVELLFAKKKRKK